MAESIFWQIDQSGNSYIAKLAETTSPSPRPSDFDAHNLSPLLTCSEDGILCESSSRLSILARIQHKAAQMRKLRPFKSNVDCVGVDRLALETLP